MLETRAFFKPGRSATGLYKNRGHSFIAPSWPGPTLVHRNPLFIHSTTPQKLAAFDETPTLSSTRSYLQNLDELLPWTTTNAGCAS